MTACTTFFALAGAVTVSWNVCRFLFWLDSGTSDK